MYRLRDEAIDRGACHAYLSREIAAALRGRPMKYIKWLVFPALAALAGGALPDAHADGQVTEQVKPYAISGASGAELYASIGQHGPVVGNGMRTIAHTNFKLTWTRDYRPQGNACTLVSARPKLIITYTLPQPSGKLPPALQARWKNFIDGIASHERVHGEQIREMVREIERTTIGVTVEDDPKCRKIREQIKEPLSRASLAQRQKSRDFDKVEMGEGGNIRRLILALVNGG